MPETTFNASDYQLVAPHQGESASWIGGCALAAYSGTVALTQPTDTNFRQSFEVFGRFADTTSLQPGILDATLAAADSPKPKRRVPIAPDAVRDECMNIARRALNTFQIAMVPDTDDDTSEDSLGAVVSMLSSIWQYASFRDQPFKDLLAAVEVSLREKRRDQFTEEQHSVVFEALKLLPLWAIDKEQADQLVDKLIDAGFSLTAPVMPVRSGRARITIEYMESDS